MAEKRKQEKSLKPSMRENKRYLLIGNAGRDDIEKAILDYIGILGYAKACQVFVNQNILAVNREEVDKIKAALLLAGIKIRKISGTLRGLGK